MSASRERGLPLADVDDLSIPPVTADTDEMDLTFVEGTEREWHRQWRAGLN